MSEKVDFTYSRESRIAQGFYLVGSLMVVLSFFLPWGSAGRFFGMDTSVSGFSIVRFASSILNNGFLRSGDVTLIVFATLLFVLSPVICHAISLLQLLTQTTPLRFFLLFPIVIWLLEGLYLLFKTQGELLRVVEFASVGFIGTVIGMLVAAFPLVPIDKTNITRGDKRDIATQEYCGECGARLSDEAEFCPECGRKRTASSGSDAVLTEFKTSTSRVSMLNSPVITAVVFVVGLAVFLFTAVPQWVASSNLSSANRQLEEARKKESELFERRLWTPFGQGMENDYNKLYEMRAKAEKQKAEAERVLRQNEGLPYVGGIIGAIGAFLWLRARKFSPTVRDVEPRPSEGGA